MSKRILKLTPTSSIDEIKTLLGPPLNEAAEAVNRVLNVFEEIKNGPYIYDVQPGNSNVVVYQRFTIL
eukprot:gene28970-32157_t